MEIRPLEKQDAAEAVNVAAACFGEDYRPYAHTDFNTCFETASIKPKMFVASVEGKTPMTDIHS